MAIGITDKAPVIPQSGPLPDSADNLTEDVAPPSGRKIGPREATTAQVANVVKASSTTGFSDLRPRTAAPSLNRAWISTLERNPNAILDLTPAQLATTSYDEKTMLLHALSRVRPESGSIQDQSSMRPQMEDAALRIFSTLPAGDEIGFDRIYYHSSPTELNNLLPFDLDRLKKQFRTTPVPGDWASWKKYTDGVTDSKSAGKNQLAFLIDGAQVTPEVRQAVDGAKNTINLSVFQWQPDSIGNQMADALIAKAKANPPVQVRVLVDGVGTDYKGSAAPLLQRMRDAGVQVVVNQDDTLTKGHLDHRKLMVVDGQTGFIGGMNIGEDYQVNWHDQQTEIRGPAVADIQDAFLDQWNRQLSIHAEDQDTRLPARYAPASIDAAKFYPAGNEKIDGSSEDTRIVTHAGKADANIQATYLKAIATAQNTIRVATPYFADSDIVHALCNAAKRGVKVQVMLPQAHSDFALLVRASRGFYPQLLKAGVEVYEYNDRMAHEKVATFDGQLATYGSSNLDARSLFNNDEANGWTLDPAFTADIDRRLFDADLANPATVRVTRYHPDVRERLDRGLLRGLL